VKAIVRRKLWSEKRGIERRLEGAVRVNEGGPVLSAGNIDYEIARRTGAIAHGGIGLIQRVVQKVGLAPRIDAALKVLKIHKPYHESDHVLNIAYNALCGGQRLEDIELRRSDRVLLDALGTASLPDPTTAGDFCRRFEVDSIDALMDAINETRLVVWNKQPESFKETARIDAVRSNRGRGDVGSLESFSTLPRQTPPIAGGDVRPPSRDQTNRQHDHQHFCA
jgi:hypothetical protein